jgi:hypothetical protein
LLARVDRPGARASLLATELDLMDRLAVRDRGREHLFLWTSDRPATIARDLEIHCCPTSYALTVALV